ncbi:hypothetical protein RSOL_150720 [Rhizoctonia solani AG-3 Rhs1AP]|uniref:Uncharacterized protein n=1 Tax=Rhizoctonia solani AG-3 Rhs1AP TaxID=1086054 RepID=X8J221_9AGAM|nr:hypothetical protein RSOL_150720 [Rhizoctonia solani AG-3 Rhs1AP]
MPKLKSPFTLLPSAPPPGSSHYISNAVIIAKRVALGLEAPLRIKDLPWEPGNPFYDWYRWHSSALLVRIQLRKEQKAPFFHEYIAFELDDKRYFRIDRRQLPNEESPMDCTSEKGVEAYDTIEEITSLDDSMYNPSDCLVEVYFTTSPSPCLGLILDACSAISHDKRARVYTVQRYNCYFYAQTILLCICTADNLRVYRTSLNLWDTWTEIRPDLQPYFPSVHVLVEKPKYSYQDGLPVHADPPTRASYFSIRWPWRKTSRDENGGHRPREMQEANLKEIKTYLLAMIRTHSLRAEQYKFILGCSAEGVERDITEKMNYIWHSARSGIGFGLNHFVSNAIENMNYLPGL